jgi:arylsulfatase A-like enzyme
MVKGASESRSRKIYQARIRQSRIPGMFRAFLAGAALAALIDAALALPVQAIGVMRREYLMLSVSSTYLLALILGIFLLLLRSFPPLKAMSVRWQAGATFWAGLALGLMPIIGHFFPVLQFGPAQHWLQLAVWMIPCGLMLLWAPKVPQRLRPESRVLLILIAVAPLSVVAAWASPSSQSYQPNPAPDFAARTAEARPAEGRPDLVLISIDTLRTDLQAGEIELLPILSELQAKGMWYPYAYSTSNQTVPAHVGLLTGLPADKHFVGQNADFSIIPGSEIIGHRLLEEAGYRTAGVISNAMVAGFAPGFEVFDQTRAEYGSRLYFMRMPGRAGWLAALASGRRSQDWIADWLHVRDSDLLPPAMSRYAVDSSLHYATELAAAPEPYFLFSHFMDTHSPYSPPPETAGRLADASDVPQRYRHMTKDHRTLINRIRHDLGEADKNADASQAAAHLRDLYDEEILYLDQEIRRLLAGIEALGRPTLVILTSDHGEQFAEHQLMEHSNSLYQELMQVPFVMVGLNGFEVAPGKLQYPPSLLDVVPTLSAAAQIPIQPSGSPRRVGINLLDASSVERMVERIHLARWATRPYGNQVAAWRGDWKAIGVLEHDDTDPDAEPVLKKLAAYRLTDDPMEQLNLLDADDPALEKLWQRLRRAGGNLYDISYYDPEFRKSVVSAQDDALLNALGYQDLPEPPPPPPKESE